MLGRLLFTLAALLAVGCAPEIEIVDSMDVELDFDPFDGPSDRVHVPYVRGTTVTLWVGGDDATEAMDVMSDDDAFLRPIGGRQFIAEKAGPAPVAIVENGAVLRRRTLPVAVPDRAEILSHGPLIVDASPSAARVDRVKVLVGGTATFLVRYYRGSQRLYGNGVLSTASSRGMRATAVRSFLFENRDWLQVTVDQPGEHVVELFADGVPVGTLEVEGVESDAIEAVALYSDRGARSHGASRVVLAESLAIDGEPILGVEYDWELDGVHQIGQGDLFRYTYDADARSLLCARFAGHEAMISIRADSGWVDSTNDTGCAVGGVPSGGGAGGFALLLVGAAALRRRRRDAVETA